MPHILLTMISEHPLKNRMLSDALTSGQNACYAFSTFHEFLKSKSPTDQKEIKSLQECNHLIINAHGDLSLDNTGPVIGSDSKIYSVSEFYQELLPILRKCPNIKTIDFLACNLGIEYDQKPSFAKELSEYLKDEFPEITVRTFIPQLSDTRLLSFVTESDDVLIHYQKKDKPAGMLPRGHFEVAEYTMSQAKDREEIILKGMQDNKDLEKITEEIFKLLLNVKHDSYPTSKDRQASAKISLEEIYEKLQKFQNKLDDHEKEIIAPYLKMSVLPEEIIGGEKVEKMYSDIRALQHAINLRERRWDQSHGFVKYSAPLSEVVQFMRPVNSVEENVENKKNKFAIRRKNAGVFLVTSVAFFASQNNTDLDILVKFIAVLLMLRTLYQSFNLTMGGFFSKKSNVSLSYQDSDFGQSKDKKQTLG